MKFFSLIASIFLLVNGATAIEKNEVSKTSSEWTCSEYGPLKEHSIENPRGIDIMNEHKLSDELLKTHKYGKDYDENDLKADIDGIKGQKYDDYPMSCENENGEKAYFEKHPYVYKSRYFGDSEESTRSETSSYRIDCRIFHPLNYNHSQNFTWVWYKRSEIGEKWVALNVSNPRYNFTYKYSGFSSPYNINYNATLLITELKPEDQGEYKCYVSNKFGNHEHEFKLAIISMFGLVTPFIAVFIFSLVMSFLILAYEKYRLKKSQKNDFNFEAEYGKPVNA